MVWTSSDSAAALAAKPGSALGFCPPKSVHAPVSTTGISTVIDANSSTTVAAQVAALPSMPMAELWALWDKHFPRRPSHRNRNYVESRLAYRIQEMAYGALPKPIRRMLVEAGVKHSKIKTAAGRSAQTLLMPGTTLVREWEEREYRVTVTPDGLYALDGQTFKSLSAAARHITGTRWNGPKFFGLRDGQGDAR
jgi:hypothetical protein